MDSDPRVGVYFCQLGLAPHEGLDLRAVVDHTAIVPCVVFVKECGTHPRLDPDALAAEIRKEDLQRIVIAGDAPGYFKPAFTRAMALAGRDPSSVHLASFHEHGGGLHEPTARAKAVVVCAIYGVPYDLVAVPTVTTVNPATLVIGGGIAGIQASLEIADAGKKVFLVEKTGTIGGHMAMFDKTFPTLDCAACILTPKMVALGHNAWIELLTFSEVQEVTGEPGAYHVKILRKSRRVDLHACVTCHVCRDLCPVDVPSEFDAGICDRKAIYLPFPQAVPNTYLVDPDTCLYTQSGGKRCGACARKCPKQCIHLDESDELVEIDVGNIIVATGYEVFDARRIVSYGYGRFPNVLTALEFERLTNASGPTGGQIVMKSRRMNKRKKVEEWVFDPAGEKPKRVAIIHCVGSRDRNYNRYCSRVCCMYSLKFAHLVREKLPDAECYEFYIDMRAFGKGYEDFFERIKDEGVFIVRGRSAKIVERSGRMVLKGEDIVSERVLEIPVDMVLLALALQPGSTADDLSRQLQISRDEDGWFAEWQYNADPTGTERGGIYVAGVCQGPKDIPDTVAQASAVAARVLRSIVSGRGTGNHAGFSMVDIALRARSLARARASGEIPA